MTHVEVRIFRQGQEITRVTCPLHNIDGQVFVKYKEHFRTVVNGNEVWIDGVAPVTQTREDDAPDLKEQIAPSRSKVTSPDKVEWDESQRKVINASPSQRLLVGAGPGTGKTAVACARVAQLINQRDLEPSRIWLISFTRTAVGEIRSRIGTYLKNPATAYAVKIATLDSHVWTIHSGFNDDARIIGSYEENIESVLQLVREDESVADYLLENVEHLIVDEAQDIVGIRADLIVSIFGRLSTSCGITLFSDDAQAIYGFADDSEAQLSASGESTLTEKIRTCANFDFRECELTEVHRTHSSQLVGIFTDVRRRVLVSADDTWNKLKEIKDEVVKRAHGKAPSIDDLSPTDLDDSFILYRRRSDVLLASSILISRGVPHRVRMSGLPPCLMPWIGVLLSEYTSADLSMAEFKDLWTQRVRDTTFEIYEPDEGWAHLVRIAGRSHTVVDMRLLRQRLGRGRPPSELCYPELGQRGPIVGTIHASKGREADTVHLMLSESVGDNVDQDEEARIVFVGATRGRTRLLTGEGWWQFARRVGDSGRAYRLQTRDKKPRAQFEVGRDTDIQAEGLTGRLFFGDAAEVRSAQARIRAFADNPMSLIAKNDADTGFVYRVQEDGKNQCIATLSQSVNSDLFMIGKDIQATLKGRRRRPPNTIPHLHVRGVRTIVLPPESPEAEKLHEPWRSSGIMLSPLVLAYTQGYFPVSRIRRTF